MPLPSIQNISLTETASQSATSSAEKASPLGSELPSSSKSVKTDTNLLTGIPPELLQAGIIPKLDASDHQALHSVSKQPLTERATSGANLKQTLLAVNNEQPNAISARNTSTLSFRGGFSLADFKDLSTCPKITKLVLPAAQFGSSDVSQETLLGIAATFPNLQQIEADGLNDLSGKVISELLATETLKSLKLENVDKQVDTLSGPLHNMTSNHLTELLYSEIPNEPRVGILGEIFINMQFDKLLEASKNLKTLSLSGHFNLNPISPADGPSVQARCQKVHAMKALTHFEMKNAPNMAEEYLAYMVAECSNLEHVNLSNNPKGVGTSFKTLLGQRLDDPSKAVLPKLKHLTFWENATIEPSHQMRGGSFGSQVDNSLKLLGTYQGRLQQLDIKVGNNVSEESVIQATKSVKHGGRLTLGLSQQVTAQTVAAIKTQRPDIQITIK